MKREYHETTTTTTNSTTTSTSSANNSKGKMAAWEDSAGAAPPMVDPELAVLGYSVRSSEMTEVAQKLEQLDMMDEAFLAQLASADTVHYNPADLASWLQSMLSEAPVSLDQMPHIQYDPLFDSDLSFPQSDPSSILFDPDPPSDHYDDLSAICSAPPNPNKRIKPSLDPSSSNALISRPAKPVLVFDSQENGIRLVHTLMACAEALQANNLTLAEALVKQIGVLAVTQAGPMGKVATYFAEALARRIYGLYPPHDLSIDSPFAEILEMHFYETCPYLKFAHFTANQAILEAFEGKSRVHVVDFGLKQGMQWPALMQALALRPGGPPAFRLTGIGPPQPDNSDALKQVGLKLAQLADKIHVKFEFRGFVANSLADLDASILDVNSAESESDSEFESEAVAVNSVFELHKLLSRPGALEKVLGSVSAMRPRIVTVVEQEASHNGPGFLDRFNESLHYYSTMFDSLEGSAAMNGQDLVMSEAYLGRQICNVVACEGVDRVERHETLRQWRVRMGAARFSPVHLGSNAFNQASMLLSLFGGVDGYRVEENQGCLTLGWHTRPLIATSAWRPGPDSG